MKTESPNIPFDRSYWVLPGRLLAGCYPGEINPDEATSNLKALISVGIHTCLDLTEENELNIAGYPSMSYEQEWKTLTSDEMSYYRRSIKDRYVPSLSEMKAILDLIDSEIQRNRSVYIHCLGGIGRTGTVVGGWLARHDIAAGADVMDHIRKLRIHEPLADLDSPQTTAQTDMVRNWKSGE